MNLFNISREKRAANCGTSAIRLAAATAATPSFLAALPPERITDVDVRETLLAGGEPFEAIMAARWSLEPGNVLRVRAIFEPVPLYFVMASQGLEHWTEKLADDDWRVWFYSGEDAGQEPPAQQWGAVAGQLDVRVIPPREKHAIIFKTYSALQPGESFLLINDHDPVPLRYQFEAEHAGKYTWEYEEQGPETWKVRIGRP